ncbi:MAG: hypothetical protein NUW12_07310 [Firmicutes bacterium]|jgi:hypothetical protein|nr:hypothetical protein [Bacillota bacterium]MDH7495958.1 hypothetical protein [Bacillota bacterium]
MVGKAGDIMDFRSRVRRVTVVATVSLTIAATTTAKLSVPANAGASNQATVPVTCKVVPALEASFPGPVSLGNLDVAAPPALSAPQVVTVRSNAPWALKIRSDAQDGRMKQWTGTGYASPSPHTLAAPLEWKRSDGADFAPISGNDAVVASGMPPTGSAGTSVSVIFRQKVSYDDQALSDPAHSYRIEVTYLAAQTY